MESAARTVIKFTDPVEPNLANRKLARAWIRSISDVFLLLDWRNIIRGDGGDLVRERSAADPTFTPKSDSQMPWFR